MEQIRIVEVPKKNTIIKLLKEFLDKGSEVAVIHHKYKNAHTCLVQWNKNIKKVSLEDVVEVFQRKGKVFLLRLDWEELHGKDY